MTPSNTGCCVCGEPLQGFDEVVVVGVLQVAHQDCYEPRSDHE